MRGERDTQLRLVMVAGPTVGFSVVLHAGRELVLGRDPAVADVVITSTSAVSRSHALVIWDTDSSTDTLSGQLAIEDIGSMNGTYGPDGRRLEPGVRQPITIGDTFHLAHAGIAFRVESRG